VQHNLLVVLPDVYQPGAVIQVVRFFGVSLMDILLLLIIVVVSWFLSFLDWFFSLLGLVQICLGWLWGDEVVRIVEVLTSLTFAYDACIVNDDSDIPCIDHPTRKQSDPWDGEQAVEDLAADFDPKAVFFLRGDFEPAQENQDQCGAPKDDEDGIDGHDDSDGGDDESADALGESFDFLATQLGWGLGVEGWADGGESLVSIFVIFFFFFFFLVF